MNTTDHRGDVVIALPEGSVIAILLEEHTAIHDLFARIRASAGAEKSAAFDELKALLARHEASERQVLRPATRRLAGRRVTRELDLEEADNAELLAGLEQLDITNALFDFHISTFERAVADHIAYEEAQEFTAVLDKCSPAEQLALGRRLQLADTAAPASTLRSRVIGSPLVRDALGSFATVLDRARDALTAKPD